MSKSLLLDHDIGMLIEAHRAQLGLSFVDWVSTDPRLRQAVGDVVADIRPRKGVKLTPSKHVQDHADFIKEAMGAGRLPEDYRNAKRTVTYRPLYNPSEAVNSVVNLPHGLRPWTDILFKDEFEPVVLDETVWGWNVFTRDGHHRGILVIHREPPVEAPAPIVWGFADTLPKTEEPEPSV